MIVTPGDVSPGYYATVGGGIIRVVANRAETRVYAQRMVVTADSNGCKIIEWVYTPGLGIDLLITPLPIREVSRQVRTAVAA